MNNLIQKLIASGNAIDKRLNTEIQEMMLPKREGITRIVYAWKVYNNLIDPAPSPYVINLLCAVADKVGERVHFVRGLEWDERGSSESPDKYIRALTTLDELFFVSDNDIMITWGSMNEASANTNQNPAVIFEGFNRPIGLNNLNTVYREVERDLPGNPIYRYTPNNDTTYNDLDGFGADQAEIIAALNPANPNGILQPAFLHTIYYVDVEMSRQQLNKWVLNYG